MKKTLIVIPTYNEQQNIGALLSAIFALNSSGIEVLVVDDNSPDGTAEVVKKFTESNNRVHLLSRPEKSGLGTAYVTGFKYALRLDFDYVMEMDADFSHDPKEIPNFHKSIEDADLVLGSRYIQGVNVINWPLGRLILSLGASKYTRIITGMPIRDCTGGYKLFRREVLENIDLDSIHSDGYAFQIEMNFKVWKKGFRIREIPIVFTDRVAGNSKMSKKIVREAVWVVWKLKFLSLFGKL